MAARCLQYDTEYWAITCVRDDVDMVHVVRIGLGLNHKLARLVIKLEFGDVVWGDGLCIQLDFHVLFHLDVEIVKA